MRLDISLDKINQINFDDLINKYPNNNNHLSSDAGQECYKLYAYISTLFKNSYIADIGCRYGGSALSLGYNKTNIVHSYDINQDYINHCKHLFKEDNIDFYNENILESNKILNYGIISVDVDPHDGSKERAMFDFLQKNSWHGLILMDDISDAWPNLKSFWDSIEYPKWDLTKYGHASGTGLVDFDFGLKVDLL